MSRVVLAPHSPAEPLVYPELVNRRILITGASQGTGPAVAHAFAEHNCRIVLQCSGDQKDAHQLADELTPVASAIRVFSCELQDDASSARLADAALRAFDGIDIVVNHVDLGIDHLRRAANQDDAETTIARALSSQSAACSVIASRLRLTGMGGLFLHLAHLPGHHQFSPLGIVARVGLEAFTSGQAQEFGEDDVRINALLSVGPLSDDALHDVVASALHLACNNAHWLSGRVLSMGDAQ